MHPQIQQIKSHIQKPEYYSLPNNYYEEIIIRNNFYFTPEILGPSQWRKYSNIFNSRAIIDFDGKKLDLFEKALVNVLWRGLSTDDIFTQNFTLPTLLNLTWLAKNILSNKQEMTAHFEIPNMFIGEKNGPKESNPYYRSLMYFRDVDEVCHPLINYTKKNWYILYLKEVADVAYQQATIWQLGKLTEENWLI